MTWLSAFGLAALSVLLGGLVVFALILWAKFCVWLSGGKDWGVVLLLSPIAIVGFVILTASFKFGVAS